MATPKKIRIIYDESNPDAVVGANVPDPPLHELAQIQIISEPRPIGPSEARLINFSDMNQIYVKKEWVDKCEILKQPVIFNDFNLFKKFIYPLLNGDSLRWSDNVDTKQEIGQLINEIGKYQIVLSPLQIQEISDNSGITKTINMIKNYINKHENKCFGKKTYRVRYDKFVETWNKYIETLAIQYNDPIYKEYKAQVVYNTLTSDSMYSLLSTNISKNNIIYEFCDWFNSFIILQVDTFSDHVYEITSRIDIVHNMAPVDIVTLIMNMITSSKSESIAKNTLVQKISDLLKFRSISN